ncbi:HD domain-containing protein [Mucilaginibacter mallensis]|uniref:HD domain-containing protein n=1 Tax=Mucilaginibacter mallensis TaxID=652787 RepID=A0A1H1SEC4_MUCMA|nr:Pycsar system effector family protein [Mucilaginibacter mallensis]SDS45729.1 HD domain-containing protein [Mucilaginibacter mallensis]
MNYHKLLEQVKDYVLNYYKAHDTTNFHYHNAEHTEDVVTAAAKIANHYQLNDHDYFIVTAAAWFHDLGYMVSITNHEDEGIKIATTFFKEHQLDDEDIKLIAGCITATKMPQSPITLLEQIICDADLYNLGTDNFFKKDKKLLKEYNVLHNADMTKTEWWTKTVKFLEAQYYHTDYAKLLLNDTKEKNLQELKDRLARNEEDEPVEAPAIVQEPSTPLAVAEAEEEQGKKKKKDKGKDKNKPDKGIETMFRISSSNHQRLSDMADRKAHIMITVNSIILSAIISLVLRRLDAYGYLIVPSFILLTVSLIAMTFSILSTRPSIPKGTFTLDDVNEKRVNLLFFGNFYKMKLEDFNYGMQKMMQEKDFLYGSLIRDLYAQGVVLGRKYHLLRVAYNVFMFGLIVSVLAFIVAFIFFNHQLPEVAHVKNK